MPVPRLIAHFPSPATPPAIVSNKIFDLAMSRLAARARPRWRLWRKSMLYTLVFGWIGQPIL